MILSSFYIFVLFKLLLLSLPFFNRKVVGPDEKKYSGGCLKLPRIKATSASIYESSIKK